ncbi:MAG TPA: ATPase domain-containing protein [Luteitalea sp.]|nr:ATPase domain-containing protein [Luteitalea sp.]
MAEGSRASSMAATGISGLDDVLMGGFARQRLFLVEGMPGSGKTTLAVQFLLTGAAAGEPVLYVTLSETLEELTVVAASHGWSLDGVTVRELSPPETELEPEEQNTMFHTSELELASTVKRVLDDVDRLKPTRVVFDSLSELRLLAGNPLRYRRQILALKQFFANRRCTVLLLDDMTATDHDLQMQSIAHGVVRLEQVQPDYGSQRRRLRIIKYRGVKFRGGYHDYAIERGGLRVYPRLVAAEHRQDAARGRLASGVPALDTLLGGGLEEGTSTLILGAAGTGKSTMAAQFAAAAAGRGQKSAFFLFDESPQTLTLRCDSMGIPFNDAITAGSISVQQVDPGELTPGELTHAIRTAVEDGVSIIVIDSLNGYLNAMPEERFLTIQLHEVLTYLGQQNIATMLIAGHQGLVGSNMQTPIDASYLADAVLLLRYFEAQGEVRQALSVMKKRGGQHERTIREFRLQSDGIHVGDALRDFRGVLTGVPVYEGPDLKPS